MTREAAVLGIPTISVYQGKLLDVDKYLIKTGFMIHQKKVTAEHVLSYLARSEKRQPNMILLQKGKDAYHMIRNLVINQPEDNNVNRIY